jgi:tRNA (guanine-N7-)-methyltransferase
MPHIRVQPFQWPTMPFVADGVRFACLARNMAFDNEALIDVEVEGSEFLLQLKEQGDSWLIKAEKATRPSPNALVKRALKALIDRCNPTVLHENIANVEAATLKAPLPWLKEINTFSSDVLPDKPLWIEVGFGSGRHLIHQAKANPDVHLIGLEIHRPSIEQVMRRIELEKLDNVWLIDYDARLFMELLPSNRAERIFVHFPVPWDKKPHRRVISPAFTEEAMRVLKPGGTLELRTDSERYYAYAVELFSRRKKVQMQIWKNADAAVQSKYEARWLRLGKEIYEVHLRALESSPPRAVTGDFSFESASGIAELYRRRPEKAWVREGFFVHLERFYDAGDAGGLIRLSMGSFDRPEHLYLKVAKGHARYYPRSPVPTATNAAAHAFLKEWLTCDT